MKMLIYFLVLVSVLIISGILALHQYQDKLVFDPDEIVDEYEYSFNEKFEEVFIRTDDSRINAVHFKLPNPKGIILYCHGNSGSLNTWGLVGEEFIRTGYEFFVFDYRGYGKSKGSRTEKGMHKDVSKIYDHLLTLYPENKIVVYGRSLGTGFATKIASERNPKALILETPYYNFISIAKGYFPWLPVSIILKYTIRTDLWLPKVKCPVLIFHGTADEVIPYSNSILLQKYLKPGDSYVTIDHANHNNIPLFSDYSLHLERYLK